MKIKQQEESKASDCLGCIKRKQQNKRHEYHFKLARKLCLKYSIICLEDLNMKWMQKGVYGA